MGILDGKVALITGAGGGLGRAYALLLAREGAKVVVNDLGTSRDGGPLENEMAAAVVKEITAAGGEAVANFGNVAVEEDAAAMVAQAVDAFGSIDIVINNAGILRDKTLLKMEKSMWDAVLAVHLTGTFLVSREALKVMMKAGTGGRIINTTSFAGLKGNFGQTNYGAAKAGIAGFTRSLALEGRKFGIYTNAIAPVAKTRMTEEIALIPDEYTPEDIAPLVVWLTSDAAEGVTGRVFGAHGRHYFEYLVETTPGVERSEPWTPTLVGEHFEAITKVAQAGSAEGADEVKALIQALPEVFDSQKGARWEASIAFVIKGSGTYGLDISAGKATFIDGAPASPKGKVEFDSPETLLELAAGKLNAQKAFMSGKISTNNMEVLMKFASLFDLEAAGRIVMGDSGANDSPSDTVQSSTKTEGPNLAALNKKFKPKARFVTPEEIDAFARAVDDTNPRYLQESGSEQIGSPTFAVQPLFDALETAMMDDELDADMLHLVHGDQEMTFHGVIRPWDLLTPRSYIGAIVEKSSGWLIDVHQNLYRDGELLIEARSGLFVRRPKGADGTRSPKKKPAPSEEATQEAPTPIFEQSQVVSADQPRRYADASGDQNPIHVDKEVALSAGLPDVILHGLCTMAFAARALVEGPLEGKGEDLLSLKVRFASPVTPGTRLITKIYAGDEPGHFSFETTTEEGRPVLSMGEARRRE